MTDRLSCDLKRLTNFSSLTTDIITIHIVFQIIVRCDQMHFNLLINLTVCVLSQHFCFLAFYIFVQLKQSNTSAYVVLLQQNSAHLGDGFYNFWFNSFHTLENNCIYTCGNRNTIVLLFNQRPQGGSVKILCILGYLTAFYVLCGKHVIACLTRSYVWLIRCGSCNPW